MEINKLNLGKNEEELFQQQIQSIKKENQTYALNELVETLRSQKLYGTPILQLNNVAYKISD